MIWNNNYHDSRKEFLFWTSCYKLDFWYVLGSEMFFLLAIATRHSSHISSDMSLSTLNHLELLSQGSVSFYEASSWLLQRLPLFFANPSFKVFFFWFFVVYWFLTNSLCLRISKSDFLFIISFLLIWLGDLFL